MSILQESIFILFITKHPGIFDKLESLKVFGKSFIYFVKCYIEFEKFMIKNKFISTYNRKNYNLKHDEK